MKKSIEDVIVFRHFRGDNKAIKNVISIGYMVETKDIVIFDLLKKQIYIKYAIAICGHKDYFSRKTARQIIAERFKNGNIVTIQLYDDTIGFRCYSNLIRLNFNSKINPPEDYGIKGFPKETRYIY